MARLRYRGVTRPSGGKSRGWLAQSKPAGLWKSGFTSQEEAAKWLAGKLGVQVVALQRGVAKKVRAQPVECAVSSYRWVVPHRHTRDGKQRWVARVRGRWLGTFGSQAEAVVAVARCLGVSKQSLKRKKQISARRAREVFRAGYQVFQRYVPGDLRVLRSQEVDCRKDFKQDFSHLCLACLGLWLLDINALVIACFSSLCRSLLVFAMPFQGVIDITRSCTPSWYPCELNALLSS